DELPVSCVIVKARMRIPVSAKRMLRVFRIKSVWSERSLRRQKPSVARLPLCQLSVRTVGGRRGSLFYEWECTGMIQAWLANSGGNHGVRVPNGSLFRRPSLAVEVRDEN